MKLRSLLCGVGAAVLLCSALPVAATTTDAVSAIAEPIVVATEPSEIDDKVYYYQGTDKVDAEEFTWVEGKTGQAVQLNGVDQYLRYSSAQTLKLEEFTFSAWVNWQGNGTDDASINQKLLTVYRNDNRFITLSPHLRDEEAGIDGIYMEWQDRTIEPMVMATDPDAATYSALEANAWHHMALVASDTEFTLYLDGETYFSAAMDITFADMQLNTFLIGSGFHNEPLLAALLDDAYLYPQALTREHVALLAAGMDPADGGTPPTTTEYQATRPTDGGSSNTDKEDEDGTLFGLPTMMVVIPGVILVAVVVLSLVFSAQRGRSAVVNDAPRVLGEPEMPADDEEGEQE